MRATIVSLDDDVWERFRQGVRERVAADDVSTHFDLGLAYLEMGMSSDAAAEFETVLRAEPAHAGARAALKLLKGQTEGGAGPSA